MYIHSSRCELIMSNNEGLGFHIKGSAPVIIYATDPGSPAARAGVVPGSCIVEVSACEYVCVYAFVVSTGPVAQRIRHLTTNQGIPGSNPGRVDKFCKICFCDNCILPKIYICFMHLQIPRKTLVIYCLVNQTLFL